MEHRHQAGAGSKLHVKRSSLNSDLKKAISSKIGKLVRDSQDKNRMVNFVKEYLHRTVEPEGSLTKRQEVLDQAKEEVSKSFKFLMRDSPQRVVQLEETAKAAIKVDDQKKSPFEANKHTRGKSGMTLEIKDESQLRRYLAQKTYGRSSNCGMDPKKWQEYHLETISGQDRFKLLLSP